MKIKKYLFILLCSLFVLCNNTMNVEAASVSKPTVTTVTKKAGKTIIKFKKRSKYTIYYTTNGKTPKKGKSYTKKYNYSKGITITKKTKIKAISYKGKKKSSVLTKTYSVYPKPKLNKTSVSLTVGDTYTLKVTNAKTDVTWSSDAKSIASVSSKGKITAKKAGTAVIKAKVNGGSVTCKITVNKKVTTSDNSTVTKNYTSTLTMDGKSVSIGDSVSTLTSRFGQPNRIDKTPEINYSSNKKVTRYVYNSDYSRIILFDIEDGVVSGWYTSSPYVSIDGITPGTDTITTLQSKVKSAFGNATDVLMYGGSNVYFYNNYEVNSFIKFSIDNDSSSSIYGKIYAIRCTNSEDNIICSSGCVSLTVDDSYSEIMAKESLDIVNGYRCLHGIHALSWDDRGYAIAEAKAHTNDMIDNNFFSHSSTRYLNLTKRVIAAYCTVHDSHDYNFSSSEMGCYTCVENTGENCAKGSNNYLYDLSQSLYESSGHKATMLSSSYYQYGAAFASTSNSMNYLTQEFCNYR